MTERQNRPVMAVAILILSILLMAGIGVIVKDVSQRAPLLQILFFRFAFALVPLAIMMPGAGGTALLRTRRPADHAVRTLFGMLGLGLYFVALAEIPLANATALAAASPIFITVFAIPVLGERVGIYRATAVGLGCVGMVMVAQPDAGTGLSFGALAGVGSALFAALVPIWIRRMSDTEHSITISLIYNGSAAVVFGLWSFTAGWTWRLDVLDWILLVSMGLIAGLQQFTMARSFQYSEASLLAPFEYTALPIAAVLGFFLFREVPDGWAVAGGAVIAFSGIFTFWRERRLNLRQAPRRRGDLP